jgi:glycerophosphoryl diester phosphodiesterase
LAEALDWSRDHGVAVNVELKYDVRRLDDVARAAVRAVRDARADVLFSSFDPRLLAWVAALAPVWPRALITHSRQSPFLRGARELLRGPVVRFVGAIHLEEAEATTHVVDDLRRRGLRVGVWTVNDPSAAVRFARGGVGSIITDSPGAILEGLESVRARARAMG